MSWSRMSEQVEQYLASRRAMGFDLRGEGYQLHAFARFADESEAAPGRGRDSETAAAQNRCRDHRDQTPNWEG